MFWGRFTPRRTIYLGIAAGVVLILGLGFDQRAGAKIGDLAVFDWDGDGVLDHIQVVSSITVVDGDVKIGMVGHNLDSDYRDLDAVLTVDHPGATGYFWSIP